LCASVKATIVVAKFRVYQIDFILHYQFVNRQKNFGNFEKKLLGNFLIYCIFWILLDGIEITFIAIDEVELLINVLFHIGALTFLKPFTVFNVFIHEDDIFEISSVIESGAFFWLKQDRGIF
jgi:hypothetical protein